MGYSKADFKEGSDVCFPLRSEGKIYYLGWDIPAHWAIDADGKAYADFSAHGCCLSPIEVDRLISHLESNRCEADAVALRSMIGRRPVLPSWMKSALDAGWTPPDSFRREDYE